MSWCGETVVNKIILSELSFRPYLTTLQMLSHIFLYLLNLIFFVLRDAGMTNRRDMIDEALLRPGRLEVQMEISLPNEEGRFQILNIHTSRMRQYKKIDTDVDNMVHQLKSCFILDMTIILFYI